MINSISLTNFQSHEHSELEFDKGVNVVVGPSDSGKTAVIRALRWLVWNRPSGEAFRSNWGGRTSVNVQLDGIEIVRSRDKKSGVALNSYELVTLDHKNPDPDQSCLISTFDAIKTDVPEEIQNALNINDVNLQMQLSRPFLLDDSPGDVAKHFNRVAHLDTIDTGIQNVQKWLRKIEGEISSGEQHLVELEEDLEQFNHLEELEAQIVVAENLEQKRNAIYRDRTALSRLVEDLQETEMEIVERSVILKDEVTIDAALKLYDELEVHQVRQTALNSIINELEQIETESIETGGYLLHLEEEFKKKFPDTCPLCGQEMKR